MAADKAKETAANETLLRLRDLDGATESGSTIRCMWDKATGKQGVASQMVSQCSKRALVWPENGQLATEPAMCRIHAEKSIIDRARALMAESFAPGTIPTLAVGHGAIATSGFGISLSDAKRIKGGAATICAGNKGAVVPADAPDLAACIALGLKP
jgi:hypothetical protein